MVDLMMGVYAASFNYKKPNKEANEAIVQKFKDIYAKYDSKKFRGRKFKLMNELKAIQSGVEGVYWVTAVRFSLKVI